MGPCGSAVSLRGRQAQGQPLPLTVCTGVWLPVEFPARVFVSRFLLRLRFAFAGSLCRSPWQSCRRMLELGGGKLRIFHGVMCYSPQDDDAKLAIRGQTSADSKCFLLRKPSPFLGTGFVLLCSVQKKGMDVACSFFPGGQLQLGKCWAWPVGRGEANSQWQREQHLCLAQPGNEGRAEQMSFRTASSSSAGAGQL